MTTEPFIDAFWSSHPCGENLVPREATEYEAFFDRYDRFRYSLESHIPRCLDALQASGKDTLEVGLGQGADSEQLIRRGARWSGVDLTATSVQRVRTRLELRRLPYRSLQRASVLDLPFPDHSFDLVYSHGVLHHVPDIDRAQKEIARVLRPGGMLVAMLYARRSLNYLVAIGVIRRIGLAALWMSGYRPSGVLGQHLENAQRIGLRNYLRLDEFVHNNTDGPLNPFSRVYDREQIEHDFSAFRVVRLHKEFMHAPPLPVHRLPGARWLGWHLWAHMVLR